MATLVASVLTLAALLVAGATQAVIQFAAPFSRDRRLMLDFGEIALLKFGTISLGLALSVLIRARRVRASQPTRPSTRSR